MSCAWFLFVLFAGRALADQKNHSAENGLRGLKKGCPRLFPSPEDDCKFEGQFCEYNFVYMPTQEYDPSTGDVVCKLPYTSCSPLAGCHCVDLDEAGTGRLGWTCFSAALAACSNDIFVTEPVPEYTYQPCKPRMNSKKFPST